MKIRYKLILNYSVLSIMLLLIFTMIVVFAYLKYKQQNFNLRLYNRAISSANLLLNVDGIDSTMLRSIDRNTVTILEDLQITIFSQNGKVLYSNAQLGNRTNSASQSDTTDGSGFWKYLMMERKTIVFEYNKYGNKYKIKASAIDVAGMKEFMSLVEILSGVLIISLLFIVGFGRYNAFWSLKPFKDIIREVEQIDPTLVKSVFQ